MFSRRGAALEIQEININYLENATSKTLLMYPLFLDSFEQQAASSPTAAAARFGSDEMSYRELETASAALAAELERRGVGPNCLVPILVERSLNLPVAILGVLRAGAAYVPVEARWPEARLREVFAQVRAEIAVVEAGQSDLLPSGHSFVEVDRERPPAGALEVRSATPDDAAYVMFTSGSTGEPKGIVVDHRALASFLGWAREYFELGPDSRVIQFSRLTFDASIWEIFGTFSSGGTLVLVPAGVAESPPLLSEAMEAFRITHCDIVPSVLGMLDPERAPALRQCMSGGERILRELVEQWAAPGRTFVNGYGPAEATVVSIAARCMPGESGPVPIGKAIEGVDIYLLDDELVPVSRGKTGEVFLAGPTLARGYVGMPRETADRFVPDPFSGRPGERMYRTGDLARELDDGKLAFIGRRDRQVKIAGQRVEPEEVEAILGAVPGVADCAVVAVEKSHRKRLAAFITGSVSADSASRECRARLPEHLVPNTIEVLDDLPLGSSGKIDRSALIARAGGRQTRADVVLGPAGRDAEALVLQAATEVLGTPPDPSRSFVEMGGDSLDAMRLIGRLPVQLGRQLTVGEILHADSLREACATLDKIEVADGQPPSSEP